MNCQKGFIKNTLQIERKDNIMKKKIVSAVITTAMLLSSMQLGTAWAATLSTRTLDFESSAADSGFIANYTEDNLYDVEGNKSLNLVSGTDVKIEFADDNGAKTVLSDGKEISIKFDIKFESSISSAAEIIPNFTDSEGNAIESELCGLVVKGGKLIVTGHAAAEERYSGSAKEPYTVEYVIDKEAKTYKVLVNSEEQFSGELNNSPSSVGGLDSIGLTGTKSKYVLVDNITVELSDGEETPVEPEEPPVNPEEPPVEPDTASELVFSYDFENDTVGKAPGESDVLELRYYNSSLSKDEYFPVVEKEDINGNMSKMLHWDHNADVTYTDNNRITFSLGNVEAEYLEYTCDVMIKSENHTGPTFGARDYCYDENGNKTEWGNWGLPACTFGRYNQNWYTKTWDGKAPQFTAAADKWVRLRYIVNTTKNTMTVYYNDTPLKEAVDVAPDRGGQDKNRDIDGWVNFQIYGGRDVKTDFDFYFDNFNVYARKALNFTAQQGNTDVKTTGAELAFVSNREFTTMSDPIVLDSEGKALSQNDYSVTKSNNGFTVKFNNGALKKKSKYTIKVASAEDSKKIGLPDAYLYEFVTEPLAFDATYKVTESGNEVTSLTGLDGKTLNINSINGNYEVDGNVSFVSAAVLSDSKGEIKQIIELDSGSLAKGTKSEKDNTLTLPNEDLTGYMLKILTWDSVANGNVLFDTVDIQGKATQVEDTQGDVN